MGPKGKGGWGNPRRGKRGRGGGGGGGGGGGNQQRANRYRNFDSHRRFLNSSHQPQFHNPNPQMNRSQIQTGYPNFSGAPNSHDSGPKMNFTIENVRTDQEIKQERLDMEIQESSSFWGESSDTRTVKLEPPEQSDNVEEQEKSRHVVFTPSDTGGVVVVQPDPEQLPEEQNIWQPEAEKLQEEQNVWPPEAAKRSDEQDIWQQTMETNNQDSLKRDISPPAIGQLHYKRLRTNSGTSTGFNMVVVNQDQMNDMHGSNLEVPALSGPHNMANVKPIALDETQVKVLLALKDGEELEANALAKRIGFSNKKAVNPNIYGLLRKELVKKVQEMPPVWSITAEGHAQIQAQNLVQPETESIQAASSFWNATSESSHEENPEILKPQISNLVNKPIGRGIGRGILNVEALLQRKPGPAREETGSFVIREYDHRMTTEKEDTLSSNRPHVTVGQRPTPMEEADDQPEPKSSSQQMHSSFPPPNITRTLNANSRPVIAGHQQQQKQKQGFKPPPAPQDLIRSRNTGPSNTFHAQSHNPPPTSMVKSNSAGNLHHQSGPTPLMSLNPTPSLEAARGKASMLKTAVARDTLSRPINRPNNSSIGNPNLSRSTPILNSVSLPLPPHQIVGSRAPSESDPGIDAQAKLLGALQKIETQTKIMSELEKQVGQELDSAMDLGEPEPKATRQPISKGSFSEVIKNPMSTLNEWAQVNKAKHSIELLGHSGPSHRPKFRMAAVINGKQYPVVTSTSKRDGKAEAATAAIKMLTAEGLFHPKKSKPSFPQTMASPSPGNSLPTPSPHPPPSMDAGPVSLPAMSLDSLSSVTGESFAALNKNPISALMEWAQVRKMVASIDTIGQTGPSHRPKFRMQVTIGGRVFPPVIVNSKKEGRKEAAEMTLKMLMAEGSFQIQQDSSIPKMPEGEAATHFDRMAALSHQKFQQLLNTVSESMAGRKILAALIMKSSSEDEGTVISLGTGNRCITGQYMSLEGSVVNDSHAEIITRRGFIRVLYKNLLDHQPGTGDSMFEAQLGSSGKYSLRKNFTFHLYISTAPCGDGALFSPRGDEPEQSNAPKDDSKHNPTFTSKVQGVLRTKMEGGEGTIPIEDDFTELTFDGVMRGERLRTMSCSDKICRWNALGMQGALLTHFIEPVYLDSLTLGLLYDHGHLARAVCCRLEHGKPEIKNSLPATYHINHPRLGRVSLVEPNRETQKTKEHSINWCMYDNSAELTDGTKGLVIDKTRPNSSSRLCKKYLYASFKQLCKKYSRDDLLTADTYAQAKKMATDFQNAKTVVMTKFRKSGFSRWVEKPVEEGMFS